MPINTNYLSSYLEKNEDILYVKETVDSKIIITNKNLIITRKDKAHGNYRIDLQDIKYIQYETVLDNRLLERVKSVPRILLGVGFLDIIVYLISLMQGHSFVCIVPIVGTLIIIWALMGLKHIFNLKELGKYNTRCLKIIDSRQEIIVESNALTKGDYDKIVECITNNRKTKDS